MRSLLVAAGFATLLGCAPSYGHHTHYGYGYGHHHHHHDHVSASGAVAVGLIAGVAIASMAREPEPPPPPTAIYVYNSPPPVIVAAAPPPRVEPRAPELPPLDPTATRNAFAGADLSGCDAPQVFGHAKISLNPDGRVSRVVVEDPAHLDPAVAQCIGKRIGRVTVPPFRGGMVVLGTTFHTP